MKLKLLSQTKENSKISYWWNDQIAEVKRKCIGLRRIFTRNRRHAENFTDLNDKWDEYKSERAKLKSEIRRSKRERWKNLCQELDKDVWGEGYKIVHRNLKQGNQFELTREKKIAAVNLLFPTRQPNMTAQRFPVKYTEFSLGVLKQATNKLIQFHRKRWAPN